MLDEEIAKMITEDCSHGDTEGAHITADEIIISVLKNLGYIKTVEAWEAVAKWYS